MRVLVRIFAKHGLDANAHGVECEGNQPVQLFAI